MDYKRFRVWLAEKYAGTEAYLFLGLIPKYTDLYRELQEAGYILVFKEVVYDSSGRPKGNCDAELVLHAMQGLYEAQYDQVVLVASDGDYASLAKMLFERNRLRIILSPAREARCSILLKRISAPITYLNQVRSLIAKRGA